jgi:hypothetical protein
MNTIKWFLLIVFIGLTLMPGFALAQDHAGTIDLSETGQVESKGDGDDGDIRAGVSWPTVRFTDHGDGTVTDELTCLMWLKDGGCLGAGLGVKFATAEALIGELKNFSPDPNCAGYTSGKYDTWALPTATQLLSLIT